MIEGVNVVKKHVKANPNKNIQGGITEKEAPIHMSNVALYNSTTKKAGRIGMKIVKNENKTVKSRYFKLNGELVDS